MERTGGTGDSTDAEPAVAVLGTGNQGHAWAGYLALRGHDVSVVGRSDESVAAIADAGGIEVSGRFEGLGRIDPAAATTDVAAGVAGRDVVVVTVPAYGHAFFARELADCVEEGQAVVTATDNFGSLRIRAIFEERGVDAGATVAGAAISPFPGRSHAPATVDVHGLKATVPVAAVPAGRTAAVCDRLARLFAPDVTFRPAANVFEVNLSNINVPMHTTIALFNLARVDAGADYRYYGDGLTPAVERLVAALDAERLALAGALGLDVPPLPALVDEMYPVCEGDTILELLGDSPIHRSGTGPTSLDHRYVTEDVPYGLVPMGDLCCEVGVDCPTLDAMVQLYSVATGIDFRAEGQTLEKLGLAGLTAEEMLAAVE